MGHAHSRDDAEVLAALPTAESAPMHRLIAIAAAMSLAASAPAAAEVAFFAAGFDSNGPQLGRLQQQLVDSGRTRLQRDFPTNIGGGADLFWLVPPLRWLWLTTGYGYYAASNADGAQLSSHTFELGPAVYMDIFRTVFHLDVGATWVKPTFDDASRVIQQKGEWLNGIHVAIGAGIPLKWRMGIQGLLRYQNVEDFRVSNTSVDFDGFSWRLGLVYLPDEDSSLLNW